MSATAWRWMTGCIYGECETCKQPLWKDHEMLVTWRDRNYHLHCLLDSLTAAPPVPTPPTYDVYGAYAVR
jgi:hypothetical protein